jgi:hypothetical protein
MQSMTGRAPHGYPSSWDVYIFGRDGNIYHADLQRRLFHVAQAEPGPRSAALVTGFVDGGKRTAWRLAARTDDAVLLLDEQGGVLNRYPIPEALRGRTVHFAETTAGEAVMYWNNPADTYLDTEIEYRICWVASDGRVRETGLTLPRHPARELRVLGGAMAPSPLVLGGFIATWQTGTVLMEGLEATYGKALGRALTEFWPSLVVAQLVATILAVLCYRRQERYGASRPERIVWPLFVLAMGLPGWVGYRFSRSWPVLESCPSCAVSVPRDREECARCEADFPGPVLRGTEVFA